MTETTPPNEPRSRRHIAESVAVLLLIGALGSAITVWRSSSLHEVILDAHRLWLGDHEERIDVLEAPTVIAQAATAAEKLKKLEASAEIVIENQAAIAVIQSTQESQTRQLERIETNQAAQTDLILQAIGGRAPTDPDGP